MDSKGGAAEARKVTFADKEPEDEGKVLEVENKHFHPKIFNKNKSPFVSQQNTWD